MALGAQVVLLSKKRGKRVLPLDQFYKGVRRTVLEPDEMLVDIFFPALSTAHKGAFIKYALRRAQAISVVNISVVLEVEKDVIRSAKIAIGAVTPIVTRAFEAEDFLVGKLVSNKTALKEAAKLVGKAATPINDIRSSQDYRKHILEVIAGRAIQQSLSGLNDILGDPILLSSKLKDIRSFKTSTHKNDGPIVASINGKDYSISHADDKTLLRFLREDVGLVGTKEGCAEGECGACTVFLDGNAVMACMVPAPRAHMAVITTIEGIGTEEKMHPVQEAFIKNGAVQCGYCTPGFVMSAVKLLEENRSPTHDQVKQAITGNLCRCTGYYKIIQSIEDAAIEIGGEAK
jgi:carbon-monoxide dehydrogenase medium subunit